MNNIAELFSRPIVYIPVSFSIQAAALSILAFTLAQILTPADFAITRLTTAYLTFANILAVFCVHDAIVPLISKRDIPAPEILGASFIIIVLANTGTLIFTFSLVATGFWAEPLRTTILFTFLTLPLLSLTMSISAVLQGDGRYPRLAALTIINGLIPLLFVTIPSLIFDLKGWIAGRIFSALIIFALAVYLSRRYTLSLPSRHTFNQVWNIARLQVASGLLSALMLTIDFMILDRTKVPLEAIATYGLVMLFAKIAVVVPGSIGKIYAQKISNHRQNNLLAIIFRFLFLVITSSIISAVASYIAFLTLFHVGAIKTAYLPAFSILELALIGSVLAGLWSAISVANVALQLNFNSLLVSTTGLIISVILLLIFVPKHGIVGAVWAMNIGYTCGVLVGGTFIARHIYLHHAQHVKTGGND